MRFKSVGLALLTTLVILAIGLYNFRSISDWLILRSYSPSSQVISLADETTMQDQARRLFYVNRPSIDEKQEFNEHCPKNTEKTIVLGCFTSPRGIYLLHVDDPRLTGVMQVTAAHELLHSEYERLSSKERSRVDNMVSSAYEQTDNSRIKTTIESYRKSGADVTNELHSILGTEVSNLPPDLETYYAGYFKDRSKIVDSSRSYEKAFEDLKNQVSQDDKQLAELKSTIENNQNRLKGMGQSIDEERGRMDQLLSSKQIDEYNKSVPTFNQKVKDYNVLVGETKQLINQYNDLVDKRNSVVTQQQQLYKAIDSSNLTSK